MAELEARTEEAQAYFASVNSTLAELKAACQAAEAEEADARRRVIELEMELTRSRQEVLDCRQDVEACQNEQAEAHKACFQALLDRNDSFKEAVEERNSTQHFGNAAGVYDVRLQENKEQKALSQELPAFGGEGSRAPFSHVHYAAWEKAAELRAEFASELEESGFFDYENGQLAAHDGVDVRQVSDPRLRVDAEVQLDAGHSTGEEGDGSRSRLRTRIYGDYDIDGNWHAKGRGEIEKYLRGSHDDSISFDRYYLEGHIGSVLADFGAFGSTMAEGNVYDSDFTGALFSVGEPVKYSFEYGASDNVDRIWDFTASYDTPDYGLDAGFYSFDSINGVARNIAMANYRRPMGDFDFGAMLLHGWDSAAGDGTGYVFTLQHGRVGQDWKPRNAAWWVKYYHQPSSTYYVHTMNGMADYMNYDAAHDRGGFQGWGIGYNYTVAPHWLLDVEYYSLKDLGTGKRSNTIWVGLTTYFTNYSE